MLYRTIPLLLLLLLFLCSCAPKPQLSPLSKNGVILAFGDSLTFGIGAEPENSYPAVLEQLTNRTVINAGISGELSAEGLNRLESVLNEYRPDLLILCHGGNDILRVRSKAELTDNLRAMISLAKRQGIDVVLLSVPSFSLFMSAEELYSEVAKEFNIPLENDIIPDVESDVSLKSDRIHPNNAGYRLIAEAVFDLLKKHGAL